MKRNAFTLIELLVVIAIIAILAAILFPYRFHVSAGSWLRKRPPASATKSNWGSRSSYTKETTTIYFPLEARGQYNDGWDWWTTPSTCRGTTGEPEVQSTTKSKKTDGRIQFSPISRTMMSSTIRWKQSLRSLLRTISREALTLTQSNYTFNGFLTQHPSSRS